MLLLGRKRRTASAATLALLWPTWRLRKRNWRFRLLVSMVSMSICMPGQLNVPDMPVVGKQHSRRARLTGAHKGCTATYQFDVFKTCHDQGLQQLTADASRTNAQHLGCPDLQEKSVDCEHASRRDNAGIRCCNNIHSILYLLAESW